LRPAARRLPQLSRVPPSKLRLGGDFCSGQCISSSHPNPGPRLNLVNRQKLRDPTYTKKQDYTVEQIDLFAAYIIPEDVWYLIPSAVLLGPQRKVGLMLFPMVPLRKGPLQIRGLQRRLDHALQEQARPGGKVSQGLNRIWAGYGFTDCGKYSGFRVEQRFSAALRLAYSKGLQPLKCLNRVLQQFLQLIASA
jgi:hypothetical protein